jgi:hypothetical protein
MSADVQAKILDSLWSKISDGGASEARCRVLIDTIANAADIPLGDRKEMLEGIVRKLPGSLAADLVGPILRLEISNLQRQIDGMGGAGAAPQAGAQ